MAKRKRQTGGLQKGYAACVWLVLLNLLSIPLGAGSDGNTPWLVVIIGPVVSFFWSIFYIYKVYNSRLLIAIIEGKFRMFWKNYIPLIAVILICGILISIALAQQFEITLVNNSLLVWSKSVCTVNGVFNSGRHLTTSSNFFCETTLVLTPAAIVYFFWLSLYPEGTFPQKKRKLSDQRK